MRKEIALGLTLIAASFILAGQPAAAQVRGDYEVYGVDKDDMLKMRAGPDIGYRIILGLPNGTVVRVRRCERSGNTSWCEVTLRMASGVRGYVSAAYLRKL